MPDSPISIDTSEIPEDKLNDAQFLGLRAEMQAAFSNSVNLSAFCVHEAGHVIYLTRAGFAEFTYFKPRITYDTQNGFNGFPAAVLPQVGVTFPPNFSREILNDWLFKVAQGCAAGGVAVRELIGPRETGDVGDVGDYEMFANICEMTSSEGPDYAIDRETTWRQAQEAVTKDLRNPTFCKEVWDKAKEIKPKLFGIS